jgi:CDP-glucose 4,6-dehydratase
MAAQPFWRNRRVLVTGATGFLGSHLVRELVELGAWVVVLRRDRWPANAVSASWIDAVVVVDGDVVDTRLLRRILEDLAIETVMHVAAQTQVGVARRQPTSTFDTNVRGTWSMLEAVRQAPAVEQVVLASSDKAYGSQSVLPYEETMPLLAVEPYDVSKACAEAVATSYAATYGTPVAITRCANLYGPGDRNWRRIVPGTLRSVFLGEAPVIRSDGSLVRDYLYVKDGVSAYLRLAEAMAADPALAGEAFNFSAEEPLTVLAMVERIQRAAGTAFEPVVANEATGEIPAQHLSARRARETLGWAPAYSMDEGLVETVAYYQDLFDRPLARHAGLLDR